MKLVLADCVVDLHARQVVGGVALTETDVALLATLSDGRVHDRDALFTALWGRVPTRPTRAVDAAVRRLRERLPQATRSSQVVTVRGGGYRLDGVVRFGGSGIVPAQAHVHVVWGIAPDRSACIAQGVPLAVGGCEESWAFTTLAAGQSAAAALAGAGARVGIARGSFTVTLTADTAALTGPVRLAPLFARAAQAGQVVGAIGRPLGLARLAPDLPFVPVGTSDGGPAALVLRSAPDRLPAIGRTALVERVISACEGSRVVWLAGPPGVGRSTVLIEVHATLLDAGTDAVYVDLAQASGDLALVLAEALGISVSARDGAEAALLDALGHSGGLKVLVDHAPEAVCALVHLLSDRLPQVGFLLAPNTAAAVGRVVQVPPLTLHEALRLLEASGPLDCPRAQMLEAAERAHGLPMALVLEAKRLARHEAAPVGVVGLDAAFEAAVAALSTPALATLTALSVFRGSFSLMDAESVVGVDPQDPFALADLVATLAERGLLCAVPAEVPRFAVLGPLRSYLTPSVLVSAAHVDRIVAVVAGCLDAIGRVRRLADLSALEAVRPDLVAVRDAALTAGTFAQAVVCTQGLVAAAFERGTAAQQHEALDCLERAHPLPPVLLLARAEAFRCAGNWPKAADAARLAVDALHDAPLLRLRALHLWSGAARFCRDVPTADAALQALRYQSGTSAFAGALHASLEAWTAQFADRATEAPRWADQALQLAREAGSELFSGQVALDRIRCHLIVAGEEVPLEQTDAVIDWVDSVRNPRHQAFARSFRAHWLNRRGRPEALEEARVALAAARRAQDVAFTRSCRQLVGLCLVLAGRLDEAVSELTAALEGDDGLTGMLLTVTRGTAHLVKGNGTAAIGDLSSAATRLLAAGRGGPGTVRAFSPPWRGRPVGRARSRPSSTTALRCWTSVSRVSRR